MQNFLEARNYNETTKKQDTKTNTIQDKQIEANNIVEIVGILLHSLLLFIVIYLCS